MEAPPASAPRLPGPAGGGELHGGVAGGLVDGAEGGRGGAQLGIKDPLLDFAKGMEEIALRDDYFISKKLYPNVDFYSGIIYRAMGIPTNMFTVMFALGRLPGWIAHWMEMHKQGFRISRPRQIYTGATERSITPIDRR